MPSHQPSPRRVPFPAPDAVDEIIDVRAPIEFAEDHIPGAINLPVLNDAERVEVGTDHKQVGGFEARRSGAALITSNISRHLTNHFADKPKSYRPMIYCWRGGQRSMSLGIILSSIGWQAVVLDGGYKTYRRHVLDQLKELPANFQWFPINGLTGSGKTRILHALEEAGHQTLDLEGLANHKGSVLGLDPENPQPGQKQFESYIHAKLNEFDPSRPIFVEAESKKVGNLHVPEPIWASMTTGKVLRIELPMAERIAFLLEDYGHFLTDADLLRERISLLRERYGAEQITEWEAQIESSSWAEFVESILRVHYDPSYQKSVRYPEATETFAIPDLSKSTVNELTARLAETASFS